VLDASRIAANLDRIRGEVGADVQILAAVKYVPLEEMGVLREAGVKLVGENRAQELQAKANQFDEFEWHFIGQLQSRKVKQVVQYATLIHSVASESALKQLESHHGPQTTILIEVNVAGEEGKAGIAPADLPRYLEASPVPVLGLMTMPPFTENPEDSRRHFAALKALADDHGLKELSMGTSQDYAIAAAEGATIVRIGTSLYT
jgi:pyridoxal phosphate enzyme (YggS family)